MGVLLLLKRVASVFAFGFSLGLDLTVCAPVLVNGKTNMVLRLRCLVLVLGVMLLLILLSGGPGVKWAVIALLFGSVLALIYCGVS